MRRLCNKCESTMINDNAVEISHSTTGISIIKKRKGLFNNTTEKLKAAVCSKCGNVEFYVDNVEEFLKE